MVGDTQQLERNREKGRREKGWRDGPNCVVRRARRPVFHFLRASAFSVLKWE